MDENSTTNELVKNLPSADFATAAMIFVFFVASMTVMVPSVLNLPPPLETQSNLSLENFLEDSGETILLAPTKTFSTGLWPFSSYETSPKPSKPDLKIKKSLFKFPPFKGKKGEQVYHPIIKKASEQHNLDPALVKAIIMAESSYNPRAVSPKGAVGLMQLMPGTAESLGVANSFNPEQNVFGGTKYLRELIDRFEGDVKLALAAYNVGPAVVIKHNGVPPFKDTLYYVHKVYHYYVFYKNQDDVQARQNVNRNKNKPTENVDEV